MPDILGAPTPPVCDPPTPWCNPFAPGTSEYEKTRLMQPPVQYTDWLYHSQTLRCAKEVGGDLLEDSLTFRVFALVLSVVLLLGLAYTQRRWAATHELVDAPAVEEGGGAAAAPGAARRGENRQRLWHLDYFRTIAVWAVVIDHTGGDIVANVNIGWSLQWTQQFLMLISGMGFMLSRASLRSYVTKLLVITAVGMGANWGGYILAGGDRHEPQTKCAVSSCTLMQDPARDQRFEKRPWNDYSFFEICFQMGYCILLIAIAIVCAPLKRAIKWRDEHPDRKPTNQIKGTCVLYGVLFASNLLVYVGGLSVNASSVGRYYSASGFTIAFGSIFMTSLTCVFPVSGGRRSPSVLGWFMLAMIYVPRVVGRVNFKPGHWLDMFIFGLVVMRWPLLGGERIKREIQAHWPWVMAFLLQIKEVDQHGRCDLYQPYYWFERLKFNFTEFFLIVALCVGALSASDPYGITRWMSWWSLYAFCFHRFWFQLLPIPWGAAAVFGHMPLMWLLSKFLDRNKRPAQEGLVEINDDHEERLEEGGGRLDHPIDTVENPTAAPPSSSTFEVVDQRSGSAGAGVGAGSS